MTEDKSNTNHDHKQKLRTVRGFSMDGQLWGMPSKILISVVIIAGYFGGLCLKSPSLTALWALALLIPMKIIHKNDPQAFEVWSRAFFRKHHRWNAAKVAKRNITIITKQ